MSEEKTLRDKKTLRDEFAMAALAGEMACHSAESLDYYFHYDFGLRERMAERSYKIADAMLAAREVKNG